MYSAPAFHKGAMDHIVRRGLEFSGNGNFMAAQDGGGAHHGNQTFKGEFPVSGGGAVVIGGTILAFIVLIVALRYTLWGVVNTLAMVEVPQTLIQLDAPPKPVDENGQPIDIEVNVAAQRPITSSIRATIRHLHQTAGFTARWRGIALFFCYNIAYSLISGLVSGIFFFLPLFFSAIISGVIAALVLARWSTAWAHIVVSEPSAKPWYRRVPSWKSWKNVWLPVVVNSLAERLTFTLPALVMKAFDLVPNHQGMLDLKGKPAAAIIYQLFVVFFLYLFVFVTLDLPSKVTLVRVQASMLPEEDESIVPFDRSFGGKVVPEILGGSGAISFLDAWKTFDREARLRVIKLVVKICAIEVALHMAFGLILGGELAIFLKNGAKEHINTFISA